MKSRVFVVFPLYIYPNTTSWAPLYDIVTKHSDINFKIIVNPSSGPGASPLPDSNYQVAITKLNQYHNVEALGYVYCSYGVRVAGDVKADIERYSNWPMLKSDGIHINGIFLDESPSAAEHVSYMKEITAFAKEKLVHGNCIVLNPGALPDESYFTISDYVNINEVAYAPGDFDLSTTLSKIDSARVSRSTVIIHDYTANKSKLVSDTKTLVEKGLAGLFITTEHDYNTWSTQFKIFVQTINRT